MHVYFNAEGVIYSNAAGRVSGTTTLVFRFRGLVLPAHIQTLLCKLIEEILFDSDLFQSALTIKHMEDRWKDIVRIRIVLRN